MILWPAPVRFSFCGLFADCRDDRDEEKATNDQDGDREQERSRSYSRSPGRLLPTYCRQRDGQGKLSAAAVIAAALGLMCC